MPSPDALTGSMTETAPSPRSGADSSPTPLGAATHLPNHGLNAPRIGAESGLPDGAGSLPSPATGAVRPGAFAFNRQPVSTVSATALFAAPSVPAPNGPAAPSCGARQLSKLKRFLTTLMQFGDDISSEIGDGVRLLVLELVNSVISIEEFHSKLQEATNFPLRPFVIPFLKANLPFLQRELLHCNTLVRQHPERYVDASSAALAIAENHFANMRSELPAPHPPPPTFSAPDCFGPPASKRFALSSSSTFLSDHRFTSGFDSRPHLVNGNHRPAHQQPRHASLRPSSVVFVSPPSPTRINAVSPPLVPTSSPPGFPADLSLRRKEAASSALGSGGGNGGVVASTAAAAFNVAASSGDVVGAEAAPRLRATAPTSANLRRGEEQMEFENRLGPGDEIRQVEEDIFYVYHLLNTIGLMVEKARTALDTLRRRVRVDAAASASAVRASAPPPTTRDLPIISDIRLLTELMKTTAKPPVETSASSHSSFLIRSPRFSRINHATQSQEVRGQRSSLPNKKGPTQTEIEGRSAEFGYRAELCSVSAELPRSVDLGTTKTETRENSKDEKILPHRKRKETKLQTMAALELAVDAAEAKVSELVEVAKLQKQQQQQQMSRRTALEVKENEKSEPRSPKPHHHGHFGQRSLASHPRGVFEEATPSRIRERASPMRLSSTTVTPLSVAAAARVSTFFSADNQDDAECSCWNCGRPATETCSGCNSAKYCGSFCQHKDWEFHHRVCGRASAGDSETQPSTQRDGEAIEDVPSGKSRESRNSHPNTSTIRELLSGRKSNSPSCEDEAGDLLELATKQPVNETASDELKNLEPEDLTSTSASASASEATAAPSKETTFDKQPNVELKNGEYRSGEDIVIRDSIKLESISP